MLEFLKRSLNFDHFISGTAIKIAYTLFLILLVLEAIGFTMGSIGVAMAAFNVDNPDDQKNLYAASGVLCFAVCLIPVYWLLGRILFESVIVVFKINENLQKIADKMMED